MGIKTLGTWRFDDLAKELRKEDSKAVGVVTGQKIEVWNEDTNSCKYFHEGTVTSVASDGKRCMVRFATGECAIVSTDNSKFLQGNLPPGHSWTDAMVLGGRSSCSDPTEPTKS